MRKSIPLNDPDELTQLIGERLRHYRKMKGLSQLELGIQADVDRSYIGRIENGQVKVTVHTLCQLANALEVELSQLLRMSGN